MVDVLQDLVENRQVRERQNSDYVNYLRDTAPIDGDRFDASYVVETNKDVPKTLELTEKELTSLQTDEGRRFSQAAQIVYEQLYGKPAQRQTQAAQDMENLAPGVAQYVRNLPPSTGVQPDIDRAPQTPEEYGRFGIEFAGDLNYNFSKFAVNTAKLSGMDELTKVSLYLLMKQYDKLPDFTWNGTRRFVKGVVSDPSTYLGLGTLGLAFLGRAGAKQATKQGTLELIKRSLKSPYAIAAIEGGVFTGLDDAFRQRLGIEAGMQPEGFRPGQSAFATGIGTVAGPAIVGAGQGVAKVAGKAAPVIRDLFDTAGQAADDRIAQRDPGATLTSGVDPTDAIDKALSYAGRKARKSGQLVGAPPEIKSQRALNTLRRNLEGLATEGEAGRFWYERSGRAVLDAVGGDRESAEKIAQAIAITSQGTPVGANFDYALQAFLQYQAGEKIETGRFPAEMSKKLENLFNGIDWEGRKTNNFYNNLMREIDPSKVQGVTADIWMMRAFGFKNKDGSLYSGTPTDAQYTFVEEETKRIADRLGWEPQQVQAAIWVAEKARKENIDVNTATFDYSDALLNNKAQVSWESIPGRTGNHLSEMFDAPYEVQQEYHVAISKTFLDKEGNDFLAKELGIPTPGEFEAPGYFEGKVSPGTQTELAIPRQYKGPKTGQVEPAALDLMEIYSAIRGIAMKQDGVGFHRPFYNPTKKNANGVELRIGRSFSEEETARLAETLKTMSGHGEYVPIATRGGVRIINFDFLEFDNKDFTKLVQNAIDNTDLDDDIGVKLVLFHSQNGYVGNDWSQSKNGEDYINSIRDRGRPDVQRKVPAILSRLQKRIDEVDADFAERYGFTRNEELNANYREVEPETSPLGQKVEPLTDPEEPSKFGTRGREGF